MYRPLKRIRKSPMTPRISRRKRNQKGIYFNPLVSGPRQVRMMKKTGGRKSHWTVPLSFKQLKLLNNQENERSICTIVVSGGHCLTAKLMLFIVIPQDKRH